MVGELLEARGVLCRDGTFDAEKRDQAACRIRLRVAAVGLLPEPKGKLIRPDRRPRLAGCILNLWHQRLDGSPRAPKTAWMSSELASLAGTIVSSGVLVASAMTRTVTAP